MGAGLITGLRPMGCGGCGGMSFRCFAGEDAERALYVECEGCKSVSVVRPQPAKIEIEWGSGDGRLAVAPG